MSGENKIKKYLHSAWKIWKSIVHFLAVLETKIIITLFYFLMMGPLSIIIRLLRKDLLGTRDWGKEPTWYDRERLPVDIKSCKRQF